MKEQSDETIAHQRKNPCAGCDCCEAEENSVLCGLCRLDAEDQMKKNRKQQEKKLRVWSS